MQPLLLASAALLLTACISDNPASSDPEDDARVDMSVDVGVDGGTGDMGGDCVPTIVIEPDRIDFPVTAPFDTRTETVLIRNPGDCVATIDRLTQNGDRVFRVLVGGMNAQTGLAAFEDPDGDGEPGLAPGATFEAEVEYTPTEDRAYAATYLLRVAGQDVALNLTGNQVGRCLRLTPPVLEFTAAINGTRSADVELENCGSDPLALTDIVLSGENSDVFALDANVPAMLVPERVETIRVRFTPDRPGTFNAALGVSAEGVAEQVVQLVGRAQMNACPVAVTPAELVRAEVGDAVLLDGDQSRDPDGPDGRPVEWTWTLIESPDGVNFVPVESLFDNARPADGGPADDPTTPTAVFVPPAPGRYVLQLSVADVDGLSSRDCDTDATVVIDAGSPGRMLIQLTWETPGDANPDDDQGADVDLAISRGEFICTPAEPTPDWPPEGPRNNPIYDADDRATGGPESIIFADVLPGDPFLIRAIYDDDGGLGPSIATVRIFVDDALRFEQSGPLDATGSQFEIEFDLP